MDFIDDHHRAVVEALNQTVIASGEQMEGNLYYSHNQDLRSNQKLNEDFAIKRAQIALIARMKSHVLEIGFNAGHSAALMLCANPDIRYTGIDICEHSYSERCADVLAEYFPGRFRFFPGDSTKVYPERAQALRDCDLVHVDGGHTLQLFRADMENALFLPYDVERHILVDDTEDAYWTAITPELNRWIGEGWVAVDTIGGQLQAHGKHLLVKPLKR
ncbi:MAG: class I SAM-dependent methyltransferase [Oxalobacteraceae bacterium]|nr:MAG: class I SAM-dependent methyltransferase [Oxalobacteraceae bacterium]